MPPMKCCRKTWSVGSDDFVLSSTVGVIFHTVWLGGLIAFSLVVLVRRECFPEGPRKKLAFAFIFSQIAIQALVIISEGLVGLISSRGTINNSRPRRILPHFLRLRAVLYAVEILGCTFGCYVVWSPYITDHIECERGDRVRQALQAYVISVIVVLTVIAILFMIYFDPLGLQTPSLLRELHHGDVDDDDVVIEVKKVQRKRYGNKTIKVDQQKVGNRLYSANSRQQWTRRVKILCCCTGGSNSRSKVQALEDIAHAMATMFDGVEIVPTDFVAALMLVHRDQKEQLKKNQNCDLGAQLKTITYDHMDDSQFTPDYEKNAPECKIDFYLPDFRILYQDIRHYLKFALGIYGWPIHIYMSPLVGSACLCAHLKCRAFHSRANDFVHDNCCLANTAALQLKSETTNDDIIYVSFKNEVHLPPFLLCYDHPRKAVVLSIRGSMSLRDALTDMNMSMKSVRVNHELYRNRSTKVHAGMYKAARNIMNEVDTKLKDAFTSPKGHNYKFIITGHSLGAGVGAILAVLYREEFHNLHCYAFSPPGSLFTLPLVEYSKPFITTIIYGNDIVPRLTFRGLLYLKRNMTHLIDHCQLPKHAILCPLLFSCCYKQHDFNAHPGLKDADIYNHSTEEGIFKTPVDNSHGPSLQQNTPPQNKMRMADITGSAQVAKKFGKLWLEKSKQSSLHKFVEKMYTVEQAPAFVPGRVLYIRETGKRIRRRFWNVFGEKEVSAVWKSNEEFCHILVDTGIFDHHLPDSVQGAVDRLYQHQIFGREKLPEVNVKAGTPHYKRAKTVGALDQTDSGKKRKRIMPVTYFRSNTKSDGFKEKYSVESSEQHYTVDEIEMNEESITIADVNGNADKTVDVNKNTVEVTVHVPLEGENTLTMDDECDLPSL